MTIEISKNAMAQLVSAINSKQNVKGSSSYTATVLRTDNDGTIWVHIPGGANETPVHSTTADAQPGDTVTVAITNGRATISGNATSPAPTGRTVEVVHEAAIESLVMANQAEAAAEIAESAASNAVQNASVAATAASAAQDSADKAIRDALIANDQASSAKSSATQANSYAIGALMSLSDIEKVVGTLNWISDHGIYFQTNDETVQPGKQYYVVEGGVYFPEPDPSDDKLFDYELTQDQSIDPDKTYYVRVVSYEYVQTSDIEVDQSKTYYEKIVSYTYEPTQDVAIDSSKTYYILVDDEYVVVNEPNIEDIATYYERIDDTSYIVVLSPTDDGLPSYYERVDLTSFVPVAEPSVEEISTYYERTVLYYELAIDESIQGYVANHVSMTDEGLNLVADTNKYRAILATDGLRILDSQGRIVGLHGEEIQLGSTDGIYFSATSSILAFRTHDDPIAWFGLNDDGIWEMHIQNTYAEDMVRFGDYAFIKRQNGNMSLKWLGEEA